MFKQMLTALAVAAFALTAQAADEKKPTAQQTKMAACNKDAGEKKLAGAARSSHIKKCMADAGAKKS
jgi:hypothetical protein